MIDRLFEAGAHFGFKKSRRHPTVAPYLFTTKDGNDIFDLEKTSELLTETKATLKDAGQQGKTVLFVGTKDEASEIRQRWNKLKGYTEGFVQACEDGDFELIKKTEIPSSSSPKPRTRLY